MAVTEKRVLRLKTTMLFSGQLVMTPGDYEGDMIPPELEAEFEVGSPHVEEIITRLSGDDKPEKKQQRGKNKGPEAASKVGNSVTTKGTPDEVEKVDLNMDSLKGDDGVETKKIETHKIEVQKTETQKGEYDDLEALAAEEQMAANIDPAKDKF